MRINSSSETEPQASIEQISTNRTQRQCWWKDGILEGTSKRLWCAAGYIYSQELAEKAGRQKPKRSIDEIVSDEYKWHAKVFSKAESEWLPKHKPYNHAIDLKPGIPETIQSKIYPMPINEQEELDHFLEDGLRKGYITPSKLPIASPVFFIKKKDGRLCLV